MEYTYHGDCSHTSVFLRWVVVHEFMQLVVTSDDVEILIGHDIFQVVVKFSYQFYVLAMSFVA